MFTFVKEKYDYTNLEFYTIRYSDTNDFFHINEYIDEEGNDKTKIPAIFINRNQQTVELYSFDCYNLLPSDKPKLLRAIIEFVELKDLLNINNYEVKGHGISLYHQLYNKKFI